MAGVASGPGAIILLIVVVYLLIRVFIVAHPKNERTVVEVVENMLLELIGAAVIVIGVLVLPLFL
jgi:heme/copper-type cytochrome/quinol oxidase subunit 2